MENINKTIGTNLLKLRKRAKLTQLELAEKFNYSDKTISKWESGDSLPSIEVLYELCKFYGVSLDTLTEEQLTPEKIFKKTIKDKLLPTRLSITLLSACGVWLVATIAFVVFKLITGINYGMIFMWAVPLTFVVLLVFNSIWGRNYLLFGILSGMLWSLLACSHVQFRFVHNIWIIYLVGIPLQVAIILWAALLQKPHKSKEVKKQEKLEKEKLKTEKKLKPKKADKKVKNENLENAKPNIQADKTNNVAEENNTEALKKSNKMKKQTEDDDGFGYDYIQNKDKE